MPQEAAVLPMNLRRRLALALLVASNSITDSAPTMSKKIPVAMLDKSCVWVDEKDAAALTGLEGLPYGQKEYARAIFQRPDGKFCWSEAIPGTRDDFAFATDPKAGKLAGIMHTHHGDQENEFSPGDVRTAETLRKTSYIRANESGNVHKYEPGVDKPKRQGRVRDSVSTARKATGTQIGNLSRRDQLAENYDNAIKNPNPLYEDK